MVRFISVSVFVGVLFSCGRCVVSGVFSDSLLCFLVSVVSVMVKILLIEFSLNSVLGVILCLFCCEVSLVV